MSVAWPRALLLLWIAFTILWVGWTSWRSDWSGLDVFVPTTRQECETDLALSRTDGIFTESDIDECMKEGVVELAMRKSFVLETMAFVFAPPLVLLIIGVAIWLIVRLITRRVAARQTG